MAENGNKATLRIAFVEMLFALAIAEIAIQVANLATQGSSGVSYLAAYAHLTLAGLIIATSWVGWSKSSAPGAEASLESVFGPAFPVLLVDVLLVVFYYIIVKGVDTSVGVSNELLSNPSAANETLWVMRIFAVYLLWDIITKILVKSPTHPGLQFISRCLHKDLGFRVLLTAICFLLSIAVFYLLGGRTDVRGVLLTDGALVALVFLFRALKQPHFLWSFGLIACLVGLTIWARTIAPI